MSGSHAVSTFGTFVSSYKDAIYESIAAYMPHSGNEVFDRIVRDYVDRKGQYRRPAYLLLWSALYGGNADDALLPAAAQQASEDWILMHDDWLDSNTLRRGKPAAHILYGPEYAVNGGDALHTIMWKIAVDAASHLDAAKSKRYLDKFYDMLLTTCEGQQLDMSLTRDRSDITKFTIDDYYKSIHAKSAYYSVYGPMQIGGIFADAPEEKIDAIKSYGVPTGLAFQMKDDILDCVSTEGELGKSIGNDVREGVKTVILWHAVNSASQSTLRELCEIYSKPRAQKKEDEIRFVIDTFNELGSIDFAEQEATRLATEAISNFERNETDIPESSTKKLARESINCVIARSK